MYYLESMSTWGCWQNQLHTHWFLDWSRDNLQFLCHFVPLGKYSCHHALDLLWGYFLASQTWCKPHWHDQPQTHWSMAHQWRLPPLHLDHLATKNID